MLTASASLGLGFAFVLLGGFNVWLVLEAWSRVKAANASSRMLALHRIGGYLFIALFCVMSYYMLARLRTGADTSPTVALHLALAMLISPLLFIKVLIARYYKNQHGLLMPLGLTIFVLAFVLIASTAGPYLARASRVERVSIDPGRIPAVAVDLNQASDVTQKRCSKCHNLDRVIGARKDAQGWVTTVARMQKMAGAAISDSDAQTIVSWLVSQIRSEGSADATRLAVARALVDQRCGRCHSLERVYKAAETPEKWREIVTRMVGYAAGGGGSIQPGEDRQIIEYLSATQTPAAMNRRKAWAETTAAAGRSLITQAAGPIRPSAARNPQFDGKAAGFFSLIGLGVVVLIVRRPGARKPSTAIQPQQSRSPLTAASRLPISPLLLELVQITQQTADAKTLRFAVRGSRGLDARPGQFLTISFLFDGRKEIRCYSICSSPALSGYVEITPKRVPNGRVSVFLNDQATIGLTVEATGPFGQFCLNADEDKRIVLLAAGSGITPMMSMLRYIDDYCLDTRATLLYCARTRQDIIFQHELDDLQTRRKNFRYHVLLSQPEPEWQGANGHINKEFILTHVGDINLHVFFLCGPPRFMYAARAILSDLGITPERVRVETFGGAGASPKSSQPSAPESGFMVEFARSGKTIAVAAEQTLLEVAATNGVAIASACRQGQCGTCKTRLLEGRVRMTVEQGLDEELKSRGYVLTCVGHADGDIRLDA
jgi:ferredoxin-NADP reductase